MHEHDILKHAVAYLNVDMAVSGNKKLEASATHSLDRLFFDVASIVPAPDDPERTLIDRWGGGDMKTLGSGSDYTAFLDRYGIASLDMSYVGDYGVYHSAYDSFHWMVTEADPEFLCHQAMARLWLVMTVRLASRPILPFYMTGQASMLLKQVDELSDAAAAVGVDLTPLKVASAKFVEASRVIDQDASKNEDDRRKVNSINRRLAYAERSFLGSGLPGRTWFKHLLQAPGYYLGYGSRAFPGIAEALDGGDVIVAAKQVKVASNAVAAAANFLSDAINPAPCY
mmetsp:Transcript_20400/g.41586  ORF Transcript_20400/g.41586 Transcript_20400/m.41586 type:complete len:284 (-) Transcript_20400:2478-3329(-)